MTSRLELFVICICSQGTWQANDYYWNADSISGDGECEQFVTDVRGTKLSTNQSLVEKYRYRADTTNVNWQHLVANLSLYKDESMLKKLGFPLTNFTDCQHPSQFVFVTAANKKYFHTAVDAIGSLQLYFPNNSIYFYDLSNGALRHKVSKVMMWPHITFGSLCTEVQYRHHHTHLHHHCNRHKAFLMCPLQTCSVNHSCSSNRNVHENGLGLDWYVIPKK